MDFLQTRADESIRRELNSIRDSYHHYWDILAELLQNSRDAITRRKRSGFSGPFFIKITLDCENNSVEVFDNGIGIDNHFVKEILAPGGGDKSASDPEVGEKGVGLTFALFSSNRFFIQSRKQASCEFAGYVENAKNWLNGLPPHSTNRPEYAEAAEFEQVCNTTAFNATTYDTSTYCRIKLEGITPKTGDVNFFNLSPKQVIFLLTTKTSCGVTSSLYREAFDPEFMVYCDLRLTSISSPFIGSFEAGFPKPHRMLRSKNICTLDDVKNQFLSLTTEDQKRRYLGSRAVWTRAIEAIDGWEVRVYGIMFVNNNSFELLSREPLGILGIMEEFDENLALFKSAISVTTKGMPTGIDIAAPTLGQYPAYYKRCLFIVESDQLPFDLGRKSFHYMYANRLRRAVSNVFASLVKLAKYQGDDQERARPAGRPEREAEEQQAWDEALGLPDLNLPEIPYRKQPTSQEAGVAAIFHELVGANILSRYKTCTTGYGSRYDVRALYFRGNGLDPLRLVIEFKYSLESIIDDLSENIKHLMSIHLLVAWDAKEDRLSSAGFSLEPVSGNDDDTLQGSTHFLCIPIEGIEPVPVLLLRHFIDRRRALS